MNRFFKKVRSADFDFDDALTMLGLARRRGGLSTLVPALGLIIAGGAIGAGLGLVFAPTSGRRIREQVENRVGSLREKLNKTLASTSATETNSTTTEMNHNAPS